MQKILKKSNSGFTLLEIILVIAILAIVTAVTIPLSQSVVSQSSLDTAAHNLESKLHSAYVSARSGEQNSSWGVHVESGMMVLFAGSSYDPSNANGLNEITTFPTTLTIAGTLFDGTQADVVFQKTTGTPNVPNASDTITLSANLGITQQVTISSIGLITLNVLTGDSGGTVLYGMTSSGGAYGAGTIFSVNVDGTGMTILYDFDGGANGGSPQGSLIYSDDVLYGMTYSGGAFGVGIIFKINTDGTGMTTLYDFDGTYGSYPLGSLTLSGTTLYGMAQQGGAYSAGTIFKINTDGSGMTDLHDFNYPDGYNPSGNLTLSGSTLFGMTTSGGVSWVGNIFKINTDGSGFSDLYDFDGTYGSYPYGSLTLSGTTLYGMTQQGGVNGAGTVFKINTDGSGMTSLHDFDWTDGYYPYGSLVLSGSTLYGMVQYDSIYGAGNIFKVNVDGSGYTDLHDFDWTDGYYPYGSLILSDTTLYGMVTNAGAYGVGSVFDVNVDGTGYTSLHDFNGTDGAYPYGDLILPGSSSSNSSSNCSISNFWADSSSIGVNSSTNLNWTTSNCTSASIDQGIGAVSPVSSGSFSTGSLSDTAVYTLTASDGSHITTYQLTVTVVPCSIGSFYASPTTISSGSTSNLVWTTSYCSSASIDHSIGSVTPVDSGSTSTGTVSSQTTYTLTASDGVNSPTATATVYMGSCQINSFSSSPSSAESGSSTMLSWSTSYCSSASIDQSIGSVTPVSSGSHSSGTLTSATTFTLSATDGTTSPTSQLTIHLAPLTFLTKWGSSGTGNGQFNYESSIAMDASGYLYVADNNNNRIQKFDQSGNYISQFGSAGSGNGQFSSSPEITIDHAGYIYVTDTGNNRIQKFDSSGNYVSQFGTYGSGDGQFNYPLGIAVDSSNNVYVVDRLNCRIQKFNSSGTYVTKWGSCGSGNSQFNHAVGIALDSSNNVYVADTSNGRIQKFDSSGTYLTQWSTGNTPYAVGVDSDNNVYAGLYDVKKYTSSGTLLWTYGSQGSANNQFNYSTGTFVFDSSNNIYVVDTGNNRIMKFKQEWYNPSYAYRQKITIDHTKVSTSDQTSFPVLINTTNATWKSTGNGGHVGKSDGTDIVFTSSANVKLDYELEKYTASTGEVVAWVRIPTLSSSADTNIYMYYGNASATDQSNKTGVWDSNFKMVQHLPNGTTLSANDSTSGANNSTVLTATATTGKVDGGANFDGSSKYINIPDSDSLSFGNGGTDTPMTISLWVNANDAGGALVVKDQSIGGVFIREYIISVTATTRVINFLLMNSDGTGNIRQNTSSGIGTGWVYLTLTYDGSKSTSGMKIYVNGTSVATTPSSSGYVGMSNTSKPVEIGRRYAEGSVPNTAYFSGSMDEVRIAGIARSAGWIATEYNNQSSPSTFYSTAAAEQSY